jgi:F-type H+-transporting ATPase subunit c
VHGFLEEAFVVSKRTILTTALVVLALGLVSPAYAQDAGAAGSSAAVQQWSIITAGFALAFAAGLGALGQGRSIAAAVEAIARNPSAYNEIRGNLILGLVLIESLVIYVLLISLVLFFFKPFGG